MIDIKDPDSNFKWLSHPICLRYASMQMNPLWRLPNPSEPWPMWSVECGLSKITSDKNADDSESKTKDYGWSWKWAARRWWVTRQLSSGSNLHRVHKSWWKWSRNQPFKMGLASRKWFYFWAHEEWSQEDGSQVCPSQGVSNLIFLMFS